MHFTALGIILPAGNVPLA